MSLVDTATFIIWQSMQIAVLVVAVRVVLKACRGHRPFLAHALWAIVILKCLTPPGLE